MARLPYLNREDLSEEYREMFDKLIPKPGAAGTNLFRTLAHAPNLARRFAQHGGEILGKTALDPKLRELAITTVGRLTNQPYEYTHHWNISLQVGIPREKLEQLADYETSNLFSAQERAVIRYAVEATNNIRVSDATFDALRSFLGNQRILELVHSVAFYNAVVRILEPLKVDLETGITKG
jgi:alkylhydroperoxidase family enzyme